MKNLVLIYLVLVYLILTSITLPGLAQDKASLKIPSPEQVEEWRKEFNIPAIGIGFIEQGKLSKVIVQGDLKADSPAPKDAIFDVASLTKTVMTYLMVRLMSEGKWDLDEPLYHYWVDPDVKDDPNHKKLTTRHVLSHQTGFLNWRWLGESKKLEFTFEPGTRFGYSGEGFKYLQKALENKFDKSLVELIDTYIFEPFGMKDSHLIWREEVDSTRLAIGHNAEKEPYTYRKIEQASAADDLLTTIQDFASLGEKILKKEGLKDEIFKEMVSPQVEMKPGVGFGLGWVILSDLANEEYALFNAGGDQGVAAVIILLPKSKRGVIVMTNSDEGRNAVMKIIIETLQVGQEIVSRF